MYKWESDDNFPKGKDIKLLAKLFNVSFDYLLGLKSERQDSVSSIYDQLDDSQKKKFIFLQKKNLKCKENIRIEIMFSFYIKFLPNFLYIRTA